MNPRWHERESALLDEIAAALERYPDLRIVEESGTIGVRGTFPVVEREEILDRYQIEIRFPEDYPRSLPGVFEIGRRIPRTVDRHVYPATGQACIVVDEEWLATVGERVVFRKFLDGPVRNYFIGQSLVEAGEPWPFGQRSHGAKGLVEAYGEWFDTTDQAVVIRYLDFLTHKQVKGHWTCPCGSGKRLRDCHVDTVRAVQQRVSPRLAKRALDRLRRALQSKRS
jgi:hypothetical protein